MTSFLLKKKKKKVSYNIELLIRKEEAWSYREIHYYCFFLFTVFFILRLVLDAKFVE